MTMTDPIADMLTRIRNGQQASKRTVDVPASKVKRAILDVLADQGYIRSYEDVADSAHPTLRVNLKYTAGKPVISEIGRMSRPGLRTYASASDIPAMRGGLGVTIVSTSQGVMSDARAKELHIGGELLCRVF